MKPLHLEGTVESSSLSRQELFARYENTVQSVIAEYVRLKSLPPLVASCVDPEETKLPEKLTFGLVEYIADIETATERALENRPDLQASWWHLALGEAVDQRQRNEVIWRCGRLYHAREIAPWRYWVRNKYAHRGAR